MGNPFGYYTFGVACSEVEVDCLTGDHQVGGAVRMGPRAVRVGQREVGLLEWDRGRWDREVGL